MKKSRKSPVYYFKELYHMLLFFNCPGINFGESQERNYRAQNFKENDRIDRNLGLPTKNNLRRFCGRNLGKRAIFDKKKHRNYG